MNGLHQFAGYSNICLLSKHFKDCYRRIAMGKQLIAPTVTESFEDTKDDLECRETCENYKFKCIGYSFG